MDGQTNGRTDQRMDRPTDEQTDEKTNRQIKLVETFCVQTVRVAKTWVPRHPWYLGRFWICRKVSVQLTRQQNILTAQALKISGRKTCIFITPLQFLLQQFSY